MTYTLLEIYESFSNGQKKQFCAQVQSYNPADFARDLESEIADCVVTEREAFQMLKTYLTVGV